MTDKASDALPGETRKFKVGKGPHWGREVRDAKTNEGVAWCGQVGGADFAKRIASALNSEERLWSALKLTAEAVNAKWIERLAAYGDGCEFRGPSDEEIANIIAQVKQP